MKGINEGVENVSVCLCAFARMSVHAGLCAYVCLCLSVCEYECVSVYVSVSLSIFVFARGEGRLLARVPKQSCHCVTNALKTNEQNKQAKTNIARRTDFCLN